MAKITINLDKAKEVHKNFIRKARGPKFQELDHSFMLALEAGTSTTTIVSKKKKLRDATKIPSTVNTLEKLIASWDETLLGASPYPTAVVEDSTPEEVT